MSAAITITWPPCKAFPRGGTETYEIINPYEYRVCSSGVVCNMCVAEPTSGFGFGSKLDTTTLDLHLCIAHSDTQLLMDKAIAAGIEATSHEGPDRERLLKRFVGAVRTNTRYDNEYPRVSKV